MADFQYTGGVGVISAGLLQSLLDQLDLQESCRVLYGTLVQQGKGRALIGSVNLRRQTVNVDEFPFRQNHPSLDHILQLPDVSWPKMVEEELEGFRRESFDRFSKNGIEF